MHLFEINQGLRALIEGNLETLVDAETGEVFTAENLENLELARTEKIEGCAVVYKEFVAEADALAAEIKNLQERKRVAENKAEWLKKYLAENLNGEKFSTPKCKISYRKSESVAFDGDVEEMPDEYCKVERKLDKTAVKKALKAGLDVPCCELAVNNNINIK